MRLSNIKFFLNGNNIFETRRDNFLINEMEEPIPDEIKSVLLWAREKKTTVAPTLQSKYGWLVEYLKQYKVVV